MHLDRFVVVQVHIGALEVEAKAKAKAKAELVVDIDMVMRLVVVRLNIEVAHTEAADSIGVAVDIVAADTLADTVEHCSDAATRNEGHMIVFVGILAKKRMIADDDTIAELNSTAGAG